MSNGPDEASRRRINRVVAEIVEELGADAVVVAVTRQRRRATETFAIPFGNLHAVRGLAEFVYGHLGPDEMEDLTEEDDDDEVEEER